MVCRMQPKAKMATEIMSDTRLPSRSPVGAAHIAPTNVPALKMATTSDDSCGVNVGCGEECLSPVLNCFLKDSMARIPDIVLYILISRAPPYTLLADIPSIIAE